MKQYLMGLLLLGVLAGGCTKGEEKNCGAVNLAAPISEVTALQAYINSKSIAATGDPRGFFYVINNAGTGTHPTVCNSVKVNYMGWLTNGSQFDGGNNKTFSLSGLIDGWKEGLPLIGKGGSITLYLPPSLGYGAAANGNIPANSIIIFQIDLLDVL